MDSKAASKAFGEPNARQLQRRLSDLLSVTCVRELPVGKPHPLKGTRIGQIGINLVKGCRLVISAANEPCPRLSDGSINWNEVDSVCIEFIGDYHE